ncbi:ABC transporter permease [Luteipulveratus halotolerans]|uniref:ABC transporter permease n=1 Tax=Luteipulveratus halotolerans TaxID=1631356 RepID=A0A0L6CFM5_9MICO|nr:ABC transporter permease [Luteipulveratus halotolerans]KNX36489.1 ABC transporter permease [Luteipulveratus halotolerans]
MTRKKERIDELATAAAGEGQVADAGAVAGGEGTSLWASAWRRLRRNPIFIVGAVLTLLVILLAVFAPLIAEHGPTDRILADKVSRSSNPVPGPEPGSLLGADSSGLGWDLFSRLVYGSRMTLVIGFAATLAGFFGGLVLGTLAGAFGGWVDSVVMRIVDVMLSIPSILLATAVATLFGDPSNLTLIIAIATVQIPIFARLLRGSMLAQRSSDHVLAARSLGVRRGAIVRRHMLPNSLAPVLVQATLVLATAVIEAAGLTFLGLGAATNDVPEWGQMLGESQAFFDSFPHLAFWPAGCIIVTALGFTLMGESLREALDPKSRR